MNWPRTDTYSMASRAAVIGCAMIFAIVTALALGPYQLLETHRALALVLCVLSSAVAGVLVSIGCSLVILKPAKNRQDELDCDLLDAFLEHIPDNVFFKDRQSRFVRIGRAMADYFGLKSPSQAVNKSDAEIFSSEHAMQALADEQEILRTGKPMAAKEEKETWPDGHETWVLTKKMPLKDRHGKIVGTMGISQDITEQKQSEARMRHMALHDHLTGLPNRRLFEDRLHQAIASAGRNQKTVAVLTLDLDRMKSVNDSFGHHVGDRLLASLGKRLKASLAESDAVARLGSDEFAIALQLAPNDEDTERAAQKVLGLFTEPFQIDGQELQVSAGLGISRSPKDGQNAEALMQFADAAMYQAKKGGLGKYCIFSPDLTEATRRQQNLENDLVRAFEHDEFVLHYQPFVSTESGLVTGVESLLRWRHPKQGLISPDDFIPQMEELGMMVEVGRWILRTACRQNMDWQTMGIPPIRVAVNVSSQQFAESSFTDTVREALRESGLEPEFLELELTESRTLEDSAAAIRTLRHLKQIGVSLSLDDFGTGWSSLSYLKAFPLDRIKIDQSFVREVGTQPAAEAVVRSILSLGLNLKIPCIAEGVETNRQRNFLRKHSCAEMQGFLFSPALAAVDCTALLRRGRIDPRSADGASNGEET
jgi:diguanylate cyclase (GGDEF)-like protein/PAS domain S-box-containing protein